MYYKKVKGIRIIYDNEIFVPLLEMEARLLKNVEKAVIRL
jgi:hypothetical protein